MLYHDLVDLLLQLKGAKDEHLALFAKGILHTEVEVKLECQFEEGLQLLIDKILHLRFYIDQ